RRPRCARGRRLVAALARAQPRRGLAAGAMAPAGDESVRRAGAVVRRRPRRAVLAAVPGLAAAAARRPRRRRRAAAPAVGQRLAFARGSRRTARTRARRAGTVRRTAGPAAEPL